MTDALREALRPFARWGSGFGPYGRDDGWVIATSPSGRTLTMGDIRRAVAAYDAAQGSNAPLVAPEGTSKFTPITVRFEDGHEEPLDDVIADAKSFRWLRMATAGDWERLNSIRLDKGIKAFNDALAEMAKS